MPKKKRSEIFAEKFKENNISREYRKTTKKSNRENIARRDLRRKKYRRRRIASFALFVLILLSLIFLYQKFYNTPQRSINKAVNSIKTLNYDKEEKYFDKMVKVEDVLKESYSSDKTEQDEFLKANFANLTVDVKNKKKTKDGLEVEVDVTNVCYVDIYDKLDKKNGNPHADYVRKLADENQDKVTIRAKLLLEKNFTYYKIYESRDFVDGILGGALKYSELD